MENEIKELNETVKEVSEALQTANLDRAEEIQHMGDASKAMQAKIDELEAAQKDATDKVSEAEKRADDIEGRLNAFNQSQAEKRESVGEQIVNAESFKEAMQGGQLNFRMDVKGLSPTQSKTTVTLDSGSVGSTIVEQRLPGIHFTPDEITDIRQILPSVPVSTNSIEIVKETTALADAAVQEDDAAAPAAKQEGTIVMGVDTINTQTIAQFLDVSRQSMDDLPFLQAFLNQRLLRSLVNKENDELLDGAGTLTGLNNITGINTFTQTTGTKIDAILDGISEIREDNGIPNWVILNPVDWTAMLKILDLEGRHLLSGPNVQAGVSVIPLWGIRVLLNSKQTALTATILDTNSVTVLDRQSSNIRMSEENNDNIEKNVVTIRAEERLGLADFVPTGICKTTLI